jgi:hypothetical protein
MRFALNEGKSKRVEMGSPLLPTIEVSTGPTIMSHGAGEDLDYEGMAVAAL